MAAPTSTPLQLEITDAAIDTLGATIDDEPLTDPADREQAREVLAAVAPHLVAAELRRMVAEEDAELDSLRDSLHLYDKGADGIYKAPAGTYAQLDKRWAIRNRLAARADELDGGVR